MNVEQYVCEKELEIWTRRDQDISLLTVVDPKSVAEKARACHKLRPTWLRYARHSTLKIQSCKSS